MHTRFHAPRGRPRTIPRRAALLLAAAAWLGAADDAGAQIGWTDTLVSPATDFPFSVAAADIDGDGDTDVFVAALNEDFAWHENVLGDGTVWAVHTIAADDSKYHVVVADVDGDGDPDAVTGGLAAPDPAVWYENSAGDGTAWTRRVISGAALTLRGVAAADVDGDDDIDVFGVSESSGQLLWYENRTGAGTTWSTFVVDTAGIPLSVAAADMDDDGDVDAVVADSDGDLIRWYENLDVGGTWSTQVISLAADGAHSVCAEDVDGDGDLDVMSASFQENRVAWHENVDGSATVWADHAINNGGGRFVSVAAADMDNDGDVDAISAAFNTPPPLATPLVNASWHENATGDGLVWVDHAITSTTGKARQAVPADIDGDCDMDVVSAHSDDNTVTWHASDLAVGSMCPGTWQDLGGATVGVEGKPALLGSGTLAGGAPMSLSLTSAAPRAPALLLVSVVSTPQALFGGTLHAFPVLFDVGLTTLPEGSILLPATWPSGVPSGASFWFQYLVLDAANPYGKAMSNGVRATTP